MVVERERAAVGETRTRDAGTAGVEGGTRQGVQNRVHEAPDRGGGRAVRPGRDSAEAGRVRGEEAGAAVVADLVHAVGREGPLPGTDQETHLRLRLDVLDD
ncbi:hypothetical protein [Streptomyces sp. NPDC058622]|uniref:hypothetical protein n=1 Tax=Streptomyces sp. NPDC058622 TaxID=3346562 RepID=UPI003664D225